MKKSQEFLKNAENCARLAESAADAPTRNRFERMATAWRALAEEQDWQGFPARWRIEPDNERADCFAAAGTRRSEGERVGYSQGNWLPNTTEDARPRGIEAGSPKGIAARCVLGRPSEKPILAQCSSGDVMWRYMTATAGAVPQRGNLDRFVPITRFTPGIRECSNWPTPRHAPTRGGMGAKL